LNFPLPENISTRLETLIRAFTCSRAISRFSNLEARESNGPDFLPDLYDALIFVNANHRYLNAARFRKTDLRTLSQFGGQVGVFLRRPC